ncbi:hypothetical protein [Roseibacillus persicicus]|uniref:DUF4468 domain-containing protein n=1 Tax=Roseibacillus persicicus TaxID=454148 RepID=A0A918TVT4_9BACT|nr:hypothetical protein [Roseibacillus persicicus]GHC63508.1 hypothetical protein GCM10007100_33940 [Roseibacillus persicicus]
MTLWKLLLLFGFLALPLSAQTTEEGDDEVPEETQNATDEEDLKRFWQLSLPDGHFMVALDRIASISRSSYLLDGGLIVTEVTIDTVGNSLCRIYQITPAAESSQVSSAQRLTQRARDLTGRAKEVTGADIETMVQKNYPTTTHAKTVEYRVKERATLDALYASLNKAWRDGKGRRFAIAN